jgi:hypothetical protein
MSGNGRTPADGCRAGSGDDLASGDGSISPLHAFSPRERQLDGLARKVLAFEDRCFDMAARVDAGNVLIVDAVDVLWDSAVASGLVDQIGDDAVQQIMSNAFMEIRKPRGEHV